ncbi:hypothetical protein STVIR_5948 [Streptomyces viridochromogenes Tue57]|uniref:Uncharacterized protein n=1 Tax=Streptomyces viridochromogenes Tue57 TaxID=1160705 RepID=L8P6A2_STRVR|nr:hypothetical protein STVIR_5948 [Streptomyces viridochromogenes Tue57]
MPLTQAALPLVEEYPSSVVKIPDQSIGVSASEFRQP